MILPLTPRLLARNGPGKEAKLSYSANALTENRNSLLIDFQVKPADGRAARRAAVPRPMSSWQATTVSRRAPTRLAIRGLVASCGALNITPHVAQNDGRPRGSAIDARTTHHPGYTASQQLRKRIEESFGWMKTIGEFRRTHYRGPEWVQMHAYTVAAAYNLLRIARLVTTSEFNH